MSDEPKKSLNLSLEQAQAFERLRQLQLFDRFAGALMYAEVRAYQGGILAYKEGLNAMANPYADDRLRWHWMEGYSTAGNMVYRTMRGISPPMPRPPRGSIV